MARPGELAEVVSNGVGVPAQTVRQMARELRDAGLMPKERAGRGAGTLTSSDAAWLLLAVLGALQVKDAAEAAKLYGELPLSPARPDETVVSYEGRAFYNTPLAELSVNHTVHQAVKAMIDSQIENPRFIVPFQVELWYLEQIPNDNTGLGVTLSASDILNSVTISVVVPDGGVYKWVYRELNRSTKVSDLAKILTSRRCKSDVIIDVANLLRG